jgi:hypothetical protein
MSGMPIAFFDRPGFFSRGILLTRPQGVELIGELADGGRLHQGQGIVHAPYTEPAMKPESRDGLLAAIAKARGWIDDIRVGAIGFRGARGGGGGAHHLRPVSGAWLHGGFDRGA